MAIPNSSDLDPLFIQRQPDWARGVGVTFMHGTTVFQARQGMEQRSRARRTPVARINYSQTGLDRTNAAARELQADAEARAICIVPFWSEGCLATHLLTATLLRINVDPRADFFAPGQMVYVGVGDVDTFTGEFREIVSVVDRDLTLVAGAFTTFPAESRVYPCRRCKRVLSDDMMERGSNRSYMETLVYETISHD